MGQPEDPDQWVVDSPAIGTGLQPQRFRGDKPPRKPPRSAAPVALTISGGGFRATLAGLGAIRLLADAGLLSDLRYVSSVSGGSLANGLLASRWPLLREAGFTAAAVQEHLIDPFIARISSQSLKWSLVRGIWRTVGPSTRTDLLVRRFDEWWFDGVELEHLDRGVRWIINAANLTTGVRFGFERDTVGDYTIGHVSTAGTGLRLSTAAAASAAVPGAFAPVVLKSPEFPGADHAPVLMDGGTYDNTGLQALDDKAYRDVFLVALNAGGLLRPGPYGRVPVIRDLARANSLLYRQSVALRTTSLVAQFQRGRKAGAGPLPPDGRRGVLTGLVTTLPDPGPAPLRAWRARFPEARAYDGRDLALVPTVFDKLEPALCRALVHRGWWTVGAALATFFPRRLGDFSEWDAPA
ncbi:Patatin [Aeromicrobium sp. Root344]|uniref:patatin-like phospholipase family protein n=1 Tax=Aeromicrobium sp. Root344 TaxID=1736521 RepID=UPI000700ECB3|nr:patatin-like phospholipase family protein [Aeromicrobium sp. Root344]KQV76037.1 Patatin [Aeromicrobium sp. Root344]